MATSRESAFDRLSEALRNGRLGHAYLVTGLPGSGKNWLVSQLSSLYLDTDDDAAHPDSHHVGPESKSRRIVIEQIRDLEQQLQRTALKGSRKIAVIRNADRLQPQAANAFLKTLEEPPKDTLILLTSSLPEAILDTILSRCIEIPLITPTNIAKTPDQEKILSALNDCLAVPQRPGVTEAFRFTRAVQETLTDVRERIGKAGDASLKADTARYKQTTDGSWLEEREQQLKAQSEAEALRQRDILLQTLFDALATALRSQHGDKSNTHAVSEALAVKFSGTDLLRRLDSLETIRRRLAMGVQEALTLESGFIELIAGNDK
jgi:DNA polymerase-3 subunit delta'